MAKSIEGTLLSSDIFPLSTRLLPDVHVNKISHHSELIDFNESCLFTWCLFQVRLRPRIGDSIRIELLPQLRRCTRTAESRRERDEMHTTSHLTAFPHVAAHPEKSSWRRTAFWLRLLLYATSRAWGQDKKIMFHQGQLMRRPSRKHVIIFDYTTYLLTYLYVMVTASRSSCLNIRPCSQRLHAHHNAQAGNPQCS